MGESRTVDDLLADLLGEEEEEEEEEEQNLDLKVGVVAPLSGAFRHSRLLTDLESFDLHGYFTTHLRSPRIHFIPHSHPLSMRITPPSIPVPHTTLH